MEQAVLSLLDTANFAFCIYIVGVVAIRLTMMSWNTHRRVWQVIYFLAGVSSGCYVYMLLMNIPHWPWSAFFGFLFTMMWFIESRGRWLHRPPDYMSTNCPHLDEGEQLPNDCPLIEIKEKSRA